MAASFSDFVTNTIVQIKSDDGKEIYKDLAIIPKESSFFDFGAKI
jgi:hypothetical protein